MTMPITPTIPTTNTLTTTTTTSTSRQPTLTPSTMSAQAVVRMQSVTELSNEKIIIYIEEFFRLIQAKVNGTIKITVKKIEKVTP